MTQQEEQMIIQDYLSGTTFNKIIEKYHHKYQTIRELFLRKRVHIRGRGEASKGIPKVKVPEEIKDKIVENYLNGMGQIASGKEFGISGVVVKRVLQERKIRIRNYAESASISNVLRKKYFCNEDYFKKETPRMAYILGFLAADGSVSLRENVLKITLSQKDKELLEQIKEELEYTGEIKDATTSKGFDISTLQITCKEYKQDLQKYNIVPQKTYTFSFPTILNKKYWIDFIRGYWDGDGTICTAGKEAIRASLCGYRKDFLEFVLSYLEKEYQIPKVTIRQKNNTYYFQYSNNSTILLYKALYYEDNVMCMKRKKEKFDLLCADDNLSTRQRILQLKG